MSLDLCVCGHEKKAHFDSAYLIDGACTECPWWESPDTSCRKYRPAPPVTLGPVDALVETVDNTDAEIKAAIDDATEGLV